MHVNKREKGREKKPRPPPVPQGSVLPPRQSQSQDLLSPLPAGCRLGCLQKGFKEMGALGEPLGVASAGRQARAAGSAPLPAPSAGRGWHDSRTCCLEPSKFLQKEILPSI